MATRSKYLEVKPPPEKIEVSYPTKGLKVTPPPKKIEVSYPTKGLKVIHMPSHDSSNDWSLCLKEVRLIQIGAGGIPEDDYSGFEKELGCIPDLKPYGNFDWSHRSLHGLSQESKPHPAGDWNGGYLMYLCLDKESELRRNHLLQDIVDDAVKDRKPSSQFSTKIRGDAFVFKMVNEPSSEGSGNSSQEKYVDMDEDFKKNAEAEPKGYANKILEELLLAPTKRHRGST